MDLAFLGYWVALLYLVIFIVPIRIKIGRKSNLPISYREVKRFAEEGDLDAVSLLFRGKVFIAIIVAGILADWFIRIT